MGVGPLSGRIDVARTGRRARRRVLDSFWAVLQAAVAAALAWLVAHRVLGHPQPFFAPIAAAISLSTSHIQRSRRIAQMVAGVLLGIVVAELLHAVLGDSTAALGVIVLATMVISLAVGAGFFGDGMMFPNQAAVSAVLVVTVHRHGTGAERAIDVLVGGPWRWCWAWACSLPSRCPCWRIGRAAHADGHARRGGGDPARGARRRRRVDAGHWA